MRAMVTAIQNAPTLQYLQWVGVLDSELAPSPSEPQFPFVGIVDNGITAESMPGKKDREVLTVKVVAYQSILSSEPGSHILGDVSLPSGHGTGLLQIAHDLKVLLNDNFLGLSDIHWAHRDSLSPSEPLFDEPTSQVVLMMMLKSIYTYRRIVG